MSQYQLPFHAISDAQRLRDAYVDVYSSTDTGVCINDAVVSDVKTHQVYYAHAIGTFDYDYTIDVGTNHNEVYIEEEKVYGSNGSYVKRTPKNRTVVEWNTKSGHEDTVVGSGWTLVNFKDVSTFVGDGGDLRLSDVEFDYVMKSDRLIELDDDSESWVTEKGEESMKSLCETEAQCALELRVESKSHGDVYQNFECSVTDSTVICDKELEVGLKQVTFQIGDRDPIIVNDFSIPSTKFVNLNSVSSEISEFYNEINDQCNKEQKEYEEGRGGKKMAMMRKIVLGLWGVALGIHLLPSWPSFGVRLVISAILIATAFALSKINSPVESHNHQHEIFKKYDALRYKFWEDLQAKKLSLLEARFASLNWEPLTESEKEHFVLTEERKEKAMEKMPKLHAQYKRSVVNFPIGEPHPNTKKEAK